MHLSDSHVCVQRLVPHGDLGHIDDEATSSYTTD